MQIVPNEPLIARLYALCQEDGDSIAVVDHGTMERVTRWQFLRDILALSDDILNALPDRHRQSIADPDSDTFICLMMHSQYEQLLAFLAMYVLGATAVLLSPSILPSEAEYFMTLSGAVALVTSPKCVDKVDQICTASNVSRIQLSHDSRVRSDLTERNTRLDDGVSINPQKGLVLLLTSGTTGPPKGILHSRKSILAAATCLSSMWSLSSKDVALLPHSLLWIAGVSYFCGILLGGASAELCESQISPQFLWDRMQDGGISVFMSTPPFYSKCRVFLEAKLKREIAESCDRFLKCIEECRILATGSGYLADDLNLYWKRLRKGRPLISTYGSTELGVPVCSTSYNASHLASFCVGQIQPGAVINLQDGEEGELCIKTESTFKRYIKSEREPSTQVFDGDGFYKTGDMARREGDALFILGRVSVDMIRSNSWMVYSPSIENVLLTVPGIDAAVILGITDDTDGQEQIAALISIRNTIKNGVEKNVEKPGTTLLQSLHNYLLAEKGLPAFWLPNILRVLKPEESIPVNIRGKVDKQKVRDIFFNMSLNEMRTHDAFEMVENGDIVVDDKSDVPWRYWAWD